LADGGSIAQALGFDLDGLWRLLWVLFFVRVTLGFAIGIDDVRLSLRKHPLGAKSPEIRSLRRGNTLVATLNAILLALYVLLAPWL